MTSGNSLVSVGRGRRSGPGDGDAARAIEVPATPSQFMFYSQRDDSHKFSTAENQGSYRSKHAHASRSGGQLYPQTSLGALYFGGGGGGRGRSHPTSTPATRKRHVGAQHGDPTAAGIPPEPEAGRPCRHLNESPSSSGSGIFIWLCRSCERPQRLFVKALLSPDEAGRRDRLRHLPAAPGKPGYF